MKYYYLDKYIFYNQFILAVNNGRRNSNKDIFTQIYFKKKILFGYCLKRFMLVCQQKEIKLEKNILA